MDMKTFEVRSEEEHVGNLLFVVAFQEFESNDEALKCLWVEAQEYRESALVEFIEMEYLNDRSKFQFKTIDENKFEERLVNIFRLFDSYGHPLEESCANSFSIIREVVMGSGGRKIILLEDDFSTYSALIINESSRALFLWNDVI